MPIAQVYFRVGLILREGYATVIVTRKPSNSPPFVFMMANFWSITWTLHHVIMIEIISLKTAINQSVQTAKRISFTIRGNTRNETGNNVEIRFICTKFNN